MYSFTKLPSLTYKVNSRVAKAKVPLREKIRENSKIWGEFHTIAVQLSNVDIPQFQLQIFGYFNNREV